MGPPKDLLPPEVQPNEIEPFRGTTRIMVSQPSPTWKAARCQVFGCGALAAWRCDNGFVLCARHAKHYHIEEGLLRAKAKLTRIE